MTATTTCEFCGKELAVAQRGEASAYGMIHDRRACHDCAKGPAFQSEWYFQREFEQAQRTKVIEEYTAQTWQNELARRAAAEAGRLGREAERDAERKWQEGLDQAVGTPVDVMYADPKWGTVRLDGDYTPATLRAIADYFDEHPWGGEK